MIINNQTMEISWYFASGALRMIGILMMGETSP